MTLGSLFDGSGGFPLAGAMCGITPVWASEIEPYPLKVTAARFPGMKQLGDVTKINGENIEPVDIITFGSPCQDLSIAGKQKGIRNGKRSSLFFQAIRIIREMRDKDVKTGWSGVDVQRPRPRFAVWENVPGAFSSNRGEDFRAVVEALGSICENGLHIPRPARRWNKAGCVVGNGWSIAWRQYDAQYWGVPQRRKRIYLVADFGSERAGEILFERESVSGDTEPGEAAWKRIAENAARGNRGGDRVGCLNPWDSQNIRQYGIDGVFPTLRAGENGGMNRQGICYPNIARSLCARGDSSPCVDRGQNVVCVQNTGRGWWNEGEIAATLRTPSGGDSTKANLVVALDCRNMVRNVELSATLQAKCGGEDNLNYKNPMVYDARGNGDGNIAPTLIGDHEGRISDYTALCVGNGQMRNITMHTICNTLDCMHDQQAVLLRSNPPRKYIIRRLTPLECCRLQGFPDWWEDGVEGSDSARYKMWGNGIALPCAADVLGRIVGEWRSMMP